MATAPLALINVLRAILAPFRCADCGTVEASPYACGDGLIRCGRCVVTFVATTLAKEYRLK